MVPSGESGGAHCHHSVSASASARDHLHKVKTDTEKRACSTDLSFFHPSPCCRSCLSVHRACCVRHRPRGRGPSAIATGDAHHHRRLVANVAACRGRRRPTSAPSPGGASAWRLAAQASLLCMCVCAPPRGRCPSVIVCVTEEGRREDSVDEQAASSSSRSLKARVTGDLAAAGRIIERRRVGRDGA